MKTNGRGGNRTRTIDAPRQGSGRQKSTRTLVCVDADARSSTGSTGERSNVTRGWLATFPAGPDFSLEDVAAQLGTSVAEARRLVVAGPLRGFRVAGRREIRVQARDLAAYQRVR